MNFRRFSDIRLVYKIGFAPFFATLVLFAVATGAAWVQQNQTHVMRGLIYYDTMRSALAAQSQDITAANGALYVIMSEQAAGGSIADSQKSLTKLLGQIDTIKQNLIKLRPSLPPAQRASFDEIFRDLTDYHDAVQVVGSMLGVDFGTAADFIRPFQANYLRMTAALNNGSMQLAAEAAARADQSARQTRVIRDLMFAFAAATLLMVILVEWFIVFGLRRTVTDICEATETLAKGENSVDLARLKRGDEFGAIVRSLIVFRENQFRIIALRKEQVAMEAREMDSRLHRERLVRMISVLSETNEAILRAESREKLFELVCKAAASGGKFMLAYASIVDSDGKWQPIGQAGPGVAISDDLRSYAGESLEAQIEIGRMSFAKGEAFIVNDYLAEQQDSKFYEMVKATGTKAVAVLPLLNGAEVVGCMFFMSEESGIFSSDFVELLQRLAGNVSFALENLERAAEREKAEARIKYLATHDSLTGLPNRAMFNQLLTFSIANARRYERQCAVMFIDLDRFKLINDSLGHAAGDALLIEIARRLNSVVRESDVVARLGGDEFVVLLNEITGPEQASAVGHSLLTAFGKPMDLSGHECRVTGSIGIAMFPDDGADEVSLMKNADIAMYLAKSEGKNDVRMFSADIENQSADRLIIENGLQHAAERGELCLHYQPKQDVLTGQITGVEALLRWAHPELGMLAPIQFIPHAEETGLIVPIGRWVLNTACAQNMEWQRTGLPPMSMAVNVSPRQFSDENLLQDIDKALALTGMEPKYLQIEITESMVMLNVERAIVVLDKIQSRGVRIAIDDFGTGYSSMSMLKKFPIDTIKIDRSFVRDLPSSSEDKAIAGAIISIGKALGLKIVAEGVETIEQDKFLRDHACDEIQGFLFGKPVLPDEIVRLLKSMLLDPASAPELQPPADGTRLLAV